MPVEIRELHIKAVVGTDARQGVEHTSPTVGGEEDREELIALCVERILEILEKRRER